MTGVQASVDTVNVSTCRRRLARQVEGAAVRYEVTELGPDIEIRVSDAAGRRYQLLQSMRQCQSGQCGCPTDQYDKLDAMELEARDDEVTVRLRPLPGERLDPDEIKACLDHTTTLAEG